MIPDDVSMKKTSPGTCGVVVLGDVGGISAADFQRVLMRSLQEHPVFASVNDSSSAEYVLTVSLRDYAMVGRADRLTTRCILVRTVDGKTIWDDTLNIEGSSILPIAAQEDAGRKTIKNVIEKISQSL